METELDRLPTDEEKRSRPQGGAGGECRHTAARPAAVPESRTTPSPIAKTKKPLAAPHPPQELADAGVAHGPEGSGRSRLAAVIPFGAQSASESFGLQQNSLLNGTGNYFDDPCPIVKASWYQSLCGLLRLLGEKFKDFCLRLRLAKQKTLAFVAARRL